MVMLNPAPDTLHLASPALGPWFKHASDPAPELALPGGDLAVTLTLSAGMEWRAPANGLRSYAFASTRRPLVLANLRAESGEPAFANEAFVVLFTLLPEVELRLAALTTPLPSPDSAAAPAAGTATRARVRTFALELGADQADSIAKIEKLRAADLDAALSADDKAAFLGLANGMTLSNGSAAVTELCRPAKDSAVILANRSGAPLQVKLWCFDQRGRALDPGAVANWWSFLASPGTWDNLWAHSEAADQRTATVAAGKLVALTNAHEGPLTAPVLARLTLGGLTQESGSTALYRAAATPSLAVTPAVTPDTDLLPLPRIAALPRGAYASPATATPFAGWTNASWPAALTRDFLRVAVTDIETHLVGLDRSDPVQGDPRRRITAGRNTATSPFIATADGVSAQAMAVLTSGDAVLMAPVMDALWGASGPPASFGSGPLPDGLRFTPRALAGEGAGGTSIANQIVALHFQAGSLPAQCWVRVWSHGIDTTTGRHFPQDGGSAIADASGEAWVVLAVPDGTATGTLSCDALVVIDGASRYYADLRFARPAIVAGARIDLTNPGSATLRNTSTGQAFASGAASYRSGDVLLGESSGTLALVDLDTLAAADLVPATLPAAAAASDALVITVPAFGQTPEGSLSATSAAVAATLVRRQRNGLTPPLTLGSPVPSQERREVAGRSSTGVALIGAAPGRASFHEAPPAQLGHAGLPAGKELHAPGLAIAGPAADPLRLLMIERQCTTLTDFVPRAGAPFTATADQGGTTAWTAVLETSTHGMAGDATLRAVLALNPGFAPGQSWTTLKGQIEAADPTGTLDLDSIIDSASFDDDAAARALDLLLLKTKEGARSFATAVLAAIARAEDLIYIETPALDTLSAQGGIDLAQALEDRLDERPGLQVLLVIPERFLPDETAKLELVRKGAIGSSIKALSTAAPGRVVLISPNAGPRRPLHLAATTVIVDDAVLFTGTAHLWRRGLTFDSALGGALFDENVVSGRPAAVRAARLQLLANALALPAALVPEDAMEAVKALSVLNAIGGKGRVTPAAYPAADDPTSSADREIWNPDGRPGGTSDWLAFFAALTGGAATEFNNAIR